ACGAIAFIPIYPNSLPTVPKPSRVSRTASLVFRNLPASQSAITRLLNRFGGQNLQRGFESPPLRQILAAQPALELGRIRLSVQASNWAALLSQCYPNYPTC